MIDIRKILEAQGVLPLDSWDSLSLNYEELSEGEIFSSIIDFSFKKSGVYLYRNIDNNQVLYVGRSVNISRRLIDHYREYVGKGSRGKNDIFHNFFKSYPDVTISYYEVEKVIDQTLIEIMLQEYCQHKFFEYCSNLRKVKKRKNAIHRVEFRIDLTLKSKLIDTCEGLCLSLTELFSYSLMFNKFIRFRDALMDLYMKDRHFYDKLRSYLDSRPPNIKKAVYDYFLLYEGVLCQSTIFKILNLSSLNDFSTVAETPTKKIEYKERIEFRITPGLLLQLESQCQENKSLYIRNLLSDYVNSINIFPVFQDLRFIRILPDNLLEMYNTFSNDKFFV